LEENEHKHEAAHEHNHENDEKAHELHEGQLHKAPSKTFNFWMIATVILAIALIASLSFALMALKNPTGLVTATGNNASLQENSAKLLDYLNKNSSNFFGAGTTITLKEAVESNGLPKFTFNLAKDSQTQELSLYLIDGNKIVVANTIDSALQLGQEIPAQETTPEPQAQAIAKSTKPSVQLFVMSYCPYGNQAEAGIIPALKILGNSVDFKLRYIVSKNGSDYASLHGAEELTQDVRELCIQKYMPTQFLDYVSAVDTACTVQNISTCWKTEAEKLKLDTAKIEQCASSEKTALLDAEIAASEKYSVSGSPTLIINEGLYNGGRSSEDFKKGICSAFNTAPSSCDQNLSSTGASASGGCAT
jgi:protein-disulfide isomerase